MASPGSTNTNKNAARASARDAWALATRHYFVDACAVWQTQPVRAMERVRPIVEGFAHIVCVALDPTFDTHERGELRRLSMEKVLGAAKRYLPPERRDLVNSLKNLGNTFHHNQGSVQRSTPNMARAALLQCAELLAWLDTDILREAPPPEVAQAMRDLEAAPSTGMPFPAQHAKPGVAPRSSAAQGGDKQPVVSRRRIILVATVLGGVALVVLLFWMNSAQSPDNAPVSAASGRASTSTGAAPELAWVAAYNAAIASRDVDRILAIHAFPAQRFFMATNQSEAQLRKLYEGWFRGRGMTRDTGFRNCQPATVAADGSRALRCDTYVEPPLDKGISVVPVCLVFRADGHLTSRTELSSFPTCPPPPP